MASTQDAIVVVGIGVGAYLLYQLINKTPKIVKTATAPIAQGIADVINFWNRLFVSPPMGGVKGDVVLPDGTDVGPLATLTIKTDSDGNVYTLLFGSDLYMIGKSDSNGNWPVQLVTAPDFGLTDTTTWG